MTNETRFPPFVFRKLKKTQFEQPRFMQGQNRFPAFLHAAAFYAQTALKEVLSVKMKNLSF
jgi:hypothetical protein